MEVKKIGRSVTLKYCILAILLVFLIPLATAAGLFFFCDRPMNIGGKPNAEQINIPALTVQVLVVLFSIRSLGARAGILILERRKPKFLTASTTLFSIWMCLMVTSFLVGNIQKYWELGSSGFTNSIESWLSPNLLILFVYGFIHASSMGYFMGMDILKRGGPFHLDQGRRNP